MTLAQYVEFANFMPCGILIWRIIGDDPTLHYANDAASTDVHSGIARCIGQPMSVCLPGWTQTAIRDVIRQEVSLRLDFSYGDDQSTLCAMVNATVRPVEPGFVAVILRNKPIEEKLDHILENVQRVIVLLSDRGSERDG